jgi:3-(3-hydroxy-phenyl)propionate hydroxylase
MIGYDLPVFDYATPPELAGGGRRRYPVVIVGGGLTGLTAACDLAVRGIAAVLLDDDDTVGVRGFSSRGICMARKSLQIFDRLGLYDRFKEKGTTWSVGRVFSGADELYRFDLDPDPREKQPAFINIQQYYTEWFLVDRIREIGKTDLRWRHLVTGCRQSRDGVTLEVETPDGRYPIEADWVLACDGANSAVRRSLGLDPPMEVKSDRWCITDVRFTDNIEPERWIWIDAPFNDGRGVWRHLMADNVWRLDFQMAPDCDPAQVSDPAVARERIRGMLGPARDFEIVWVGPWSYRTYLLDSLRHGRVFFLGDAAHLMSPFGARGGNSGIQDAENLAWKLALVLASRAPERLLDSYDAERRPAAAHNIRLTTRAGRFMCPENDAERVLRRAVLSLAKEHGFARALINGGRLSDSFVYASSPLTTSGGEAAPNPPIVGGDGIARHLIDLARGGAKFLGLWFPPADAGGIFPSSVDVEASLLRCYAVGGATAGLESIGDVTGALAERLGARPGSFVLLRPDHHVAAHLAAAEPAAIRAALRKALARG